MQKIIKFLKLYYSISPFYHYIQQTYCMYTFVQAYAYLCCSLGQPLDSCLVMTKYKSIPEPKLPTHLETSEQGY